MYETTDIVHPPFLLLRLADSNSKVKFQQRCVE
jgi:hypothetical protein